MAKGQPPPPLPPAPPLTKEDPSIQAESAAERARLRARKGRSSTLLTRGSLAGAEEPGTTSLLGGER